VTGQPEWGFASLMRCAERSIGTAQLKQSELNSVALSGRRLAPESERCPAVKRRLARPKTPFPAQMLKYLDLIFTDFCSPEAEKALPGSQKRRSEGLEG